MSAFDLDKLSAEVGRIARFGVVGFTSMGVYLLLTFLMTSHFRIEAVSASLIAHLCAAAVSYTGHLFYSFRVEPDHGRQLVRFLAVSAATLPLNSVIMWGTVHLGGWPAWVGALLVTGLIPAANYMLNRFYVFRPRASRPAARLTADHYASERR